MRDHMQKLCEFSVCCLESKNSCASSTGVPELAVDQLF
jgi:hypothetical protein